MIAAKYSGKQLDTASAFTALSLISLLADPMNTLIRTIPMLNSAMACFKRIQEFLNSDARRDHRLPLNNPINVDEQPLTSEIELRTFPSSQLSLIIAQNASFGWTMEDVPTVSDVSFTLSRRQFCFIIGPVGSGKSTLLKGLLGETPSSKGFVYSGSPSTAFVDQTPWIQNATIQQNILGISSFEEPWYSQGMEISQINSVTSKITKFDLQSSMLALSNSISPNCQKATVSPTLPCVPSN